MKKNVENKSIDYLKIILTIFLSAALLRIFVLEVYYIPSASMENTLLSGDFILVSKLSYGLPLNSVLQSNHASTDLHSSFLPFPFSKCINRGDVLVFELHEPEMIHSENIVCVKRCIGIPGDTIKIKDNIISINGRLLTFSKFINPSFFSENIIVPKRGDVIQLIPSSVPQWRKLIEGEGHKVDCTNEKVLIDNKIVTSYKVQQNYYFVLGDNIDKSYDSRHWGFVPENQIIGEAILVLWSYDKENITEENERRLPKFRWDRILTIIR